MSQKRSLPFYQSALIPFLGVVMGLALASPMTGFCAESGRVSAIPGRDGSGKMATSAKAGSGTKAAAIPATNRLEVTADEMEYDGGLIHARGHVVINKGDDQLMADIVTVNRNTEDAEAIGHVIMKRGETVCTSTDLKYNFKTRVGNAAALAGDFGPYRISADKTERDGDTAHFYNAEITTCTNAPGHLHYRIRARRVDAISGDTVKAHGCVLYLGPVPVFYTPYMYRNLKEDFGLRFAAGYGSHVGAFLLSSYRYHLSDYLRGETHVDYRTKRGVAYGQDFRWKDPDGIYNGELKTYYLKDDKPWDDDDDPVTSGIEEERYRVRLRNTYNFTPQDYSFVQADYLSDTDVLEDFFEDEYRASSQPDNYASLTHKEDDYSLTLLARSRLNDFYESVNRLPELSLDVPRMQLNDSIFYYEGEQTIAQLEKVYPDDSGSQDYSAMRLDSMNTFYVPTKQFGFLNFTPRAGVRETYYSETPGAVYTNSVTVETNADSSVTTNVSTDVAAGDSVLRSSVHMGFETSFKAYHTWDGANGPLRHIVEPYADYTLVPEPTSTPDELYQFDDVDSWDKQNFIKLGNRHKIQQKDDKGNPEDLIDADVYTILDLEPDPGEDTLQNFYFKTEITPNHTAKFNIDGYYDTAASELHELDGRMTLNDEGYIKSVSEYQFVVDDVSLLSEDLTYYASEQWALNGFGRYSLEDSRMEEVGGGVQRNLDCLSWKTGVTFRPSYTSDDGSDVKEEVRVLFEMWVNAFDKDHKDDDRYRN